MFQIGDKVKICLTHDSHFNGKIGLITGVEYDSVYNLIYSVNVDNVNSRNNNVFFTAESLELVESYKTIWEKLENKLAEVKINNV